MTQFPFVRKRISTLSSLCIHLVPGLFPGSPGMCHTQTCRFFIYPTCLSLLKFPLAFAHTDMHICTPPLPHIDFYLPLPRSTRGVGGGRLWRGVNPRAGERLPSSASLGCQRIQVLLRMAGVQAGLGIYTSWAPGCVFHGAGLCCLPPPQVEH